MKRFEDQDKYVQILGQWTSGREDEESLRELYPILDHYRKPSNGCSFSKPRKPEPILPVVNPVVSSTNHGFSAIQEISSPSSDSSSDSSPGATYVPPSDLEWQRNFSKLEIESPLPDLVLQRDYSNSENEVYANAAWLQNPPVSSAIWTESVEDEDSNYIKQLDEIIYVPTSKRSRDVPTSHWSWSRDVPNSGWSRDIPTSGWSPDVSDSGWSPDVPIGGWSPGVPNSGWSPDVSIRGWSPDVPTSGWSRDVPNSGWSREVPNGGWSPDVPDSGWSPDVPIGGWSPDVPDSGWSPDVPIGGWSPDISNSGWSPDVSIRGWSPDVPISDWSPVVLTSDWSSNVPTSNWSLAHGNAFDVVDSAVFIENKKNQLGPSDSGEKVEEEKVRKCLVAEGKWIKHYNSNHRILLVGEGDFSFSASLAVSFGSASDMIATSLDSVDFLKKNYKCAMSNIGKLRSRECIVMHGIDATEVASHHLLGGMTFDRIIFNFPFAGFFKDLPREAQLRKHRSLVSLFLKNAKEMIGENGEIHISHKTNGFHGEWKLESLASSHRLRLIEAVEFNLFDYEGYNTKCGFGGDNNFNCYPSKTYKFGLKGAQVHLFSSVAGPVVGSGWF